MAVNASVPALLRGMVIQTEVNSLTGRYLYSDYVDIDYKVRGAAYEKDTLLNSLVAIPVIGIAGGVARVGLGIIHTIGHLFAALATHKKGHLYHAAKGGCEILRGIIESIPIIGRGFTWFYRGSISLIANQASWWMIKIYNPQQEDDLDLIHGKWNAYPSYCKVGFS